MAAADVAAVSPPFPAPQLPPPTHTHPNIPNSRPPLPLLSPKGSKHWPPARCVPRQLKTETHVAQHENTVGVSPNVNGWGWGWGG